LYDRNHNGTAKNTYKIKLCSSGAHTCTWQLLCFRDFDINPMTLKLEGDLYSVKMYLHTENEFFRNSVEEDVCMANEKNTKITSGQRSRSCTTSFRPLLAFTTGRIPTKLHRILISSFRDFLQTDRWTDATENNTCLQHARR